MGRWVGVDYGIKRIGLALSDPGATLASPAGNLPGAGTPAQDAVRVAAWARQQGAEGAVVGLPLNMDGSSGPQAVVCKVFAKHLASSALRVELWDERLSSFQADAHLDEAAVPRSRRKALRDAFAAQVILQSFLDAQKGDTPAAPPPPN